MFSHITTGFSRAMRQKKLVFLFFAANFIIALVFSLPFRAALSDFVGNSGMDARLHSLADMTFMPEFLKANGSLMAQLGLQLTLISPLYYLLMLFLSGGAFALFLRADDFSAQFWADSARYFWRFVRLFLWSLPVMALVFVLPWLGSLLQVLLHGDDPYQWVGYYWSRIKILLAGLGALYYHLVFDYARIAVIEGDLHNMRKAIAAGMRLVHARLLTASAISLIYFLIGLAGMLLFFSLVGLLQGNSGFSVLLLFLLQQLYMVFRMVIKLGLYAAESSFFQSELAGITLLPSTPPAAGETDLAEVAS